MTRTIFKTLIIVIYTLVSFNNTYSQTPKRVQSPIISHLSQVSCLSEDLTLAAEMSLSHIFIWDIKSGLMIKKIKLEGGLFSLLQNPKLWFSKDNNFILASIKKEPLRKYTIWEDQVNDISTLENIEEPSKQYNNLNDNFFQHPQHSSSTLKIKSPDNKTKLIQRYKPTPFTGSVYTICIIEKDTLNLGKTEVMAFCFDKDSKILMANNRIVDLKRKHIISVLKKKHIKPVIGINIINEKERIIATKEGLLKISGNTRHAIEIGNMKKLLSTNDPNYSICLNTKNQLLTISKINNNTNKIETERTLKFESTYKAVISPNNKFLAVLQTELRGARMDKINHIYNLQNLELLSSNDEKLYWLDFKNEDEIIYSKKNIGNFDIVDSYFNSIDDNIEKNNILNNSGGVPRSTSKDGRFIAKWNKDNSTSIFNIKEDRLLCTIPSGRPVVMHHVDVFESLFSDFFTFDVDANNSTCAFFNIAENKMEVFDIKSNSVIYQSEELESHVSKLWFSDQLNQIILLQLNGTIMFRDNVTFEEEYSMIVNSENDFIYSTPENYYTSSGNSLDHTHYIYNKTVFPLEQFDLKYNRPDIVNQKIGILDSSTISLLNKAYLKRLKKMNFTEEMLNGDFHLPSIKIENKDDLPTIESQGKIDLHLEIEDTKYNLDRVNVWINDVAIYGINGLSLRDKNVKDYKTIISLDLAKGMNKVQVSVLNQAGAESYKENFNIQSSFGKSEPDLYLISIGESEFQQDNFNLKYAAKDANDIANVMKNSKSYNKVYTKTLTNEQVTVENVLQLKSFLEKADINDQVIIFLAGHGVLNGNYDYFFATYDMDFNNPSEKGLAYESLEGLLDGIAPLKKALLIDACHSGEIDKEEVEFIAQSEENIGDVQFRSVGNALNSKLGSQNTMKLTKVLFKDLRKGTGATVISSAGGMEFAMESGDWKNGLFTFCLLNGIKTNSADLNNDGEIWLSEIQKYVEKEVSILSKGKQQPTSRIENQTVDFRIW